jgi:5-methylcytosine-specific restriction enzyme A
MANSLSLLTSATAVSEAIQECDTLGREPFLKKYGFKHSRVYALRHDGRLYDSKAIAGVAFGKQHGTPLKASEFSGGAATVVPVLTGLGFADFFSAHPGEYLVASKTYFRKDLVELFGGQLQAGIWTPKEFPVVFLFSGDSGGAYGYRDSWTDDGVFHYTGEGQLGDMTFSSGNKAIRDHRQNGKDLLLFEDLGKGKGVQYKGMFECAAWQEVEGKDKNQARRKILMFDLIPVAPAFVSDATDETPASTSEGKTLEQLRLAALDAASVPKAQPKSSDAKRFWYERSAKVRDYVLARANGTCECCDQSAPFERRDGSPYLEPHHTTRLADGGPDHPATVGGICPTCHRRIHSGKDGIEWNKQLKIRLIQKEDLLRSAPTLD